MLGFDRIARLAARLALLAPLAFVSLHLSSRPVAAEAITVSQWGALYYGAPHAVALAKGFFAGNGTTVDRIVGGDGGGTTVRNTLAAKLPYGEVSLAAAIEAIRAGFPIRIVNIGVDSLGDFVLVTRPGGPTRTLQDLKGKRIAFTRPGSVSQMVVVLLLRQIGLGASDVELVSVGGLGAVMTTIRNGTMDAAFTGEPLWSQEKDKLQTIAWLRDVMDTRFTQIVGIVDTNYAAKNPDIVRGILAARRKAVRFIYDHPDEAADIVAAAYGQPSSLVRSVFATLVGMRYWSEGRIDTASMGKMVDGLRLVGAIEGPVDFSKMIDAAFLPPDLR